MQFRESIWDCNHCGVCRDSPKGLQCTCGRMLHSLDRGVRRAAIPSGSSRGCCRDARDGVHVTAPYEPCAACSSAKPVHESPAPSSRHAGIAEDPDAEFLPTGMAPRNAETFPGRAEKFTCITIRTSVAGAPPVPHANHATLLPQARTVWELRRPLHPASSTWGSAGPAPRSRSGGVPGATRSSPRSSISAPTSSSSRQVGEGFPWGMCIAKPRMLGFGGAGFSPYRRAKAPGVLGCVGWGSAGAICTRLPFPGLLFHRTKLH